MIFSVYNLASCSRFNNSADDILPLKSPPETHDLGKDADLLLAWRFIATGGQFIKGATALCLVKGRLLLAHLHPHGDFGAGFP